MPLIGTAHSRLLTTVLRRKTWGALVSHNPAELNLPGVLFSLSAELLPRTGSDAGWVAAEEADFKWYRPLVCVFVPLTFKEEMLLGAVGEREHHRLSSSGLQQKVEGPKNKGLGSLGLGTRQWGGPKGTLECIVL